jgi:hypothetical protein
MIRVLLVLMSLVAFTGCSNQKPSKSSEAPAPAQPVATPVAAPAVSPAPAAQTTPAPAPPGTLSTQDSNVAGIAADFTECKRKEGVLSVKVRFRNTTSAQAQIYVINSRNYAAFYVTAANKKYFMLKDSEGTYLTPAADGSGVLSVPLGKGEQYTWWAKFPAPPPDVKKITLMTPVTPPFEDIPVTDQ